jgi:hypothetical protein
MDGFVIDFANKYPNVDPSRIMGYHNSDHVPSMTSWRGSS